ncbi:hypothetical protein ACTHAM_001885 [Cellulomonas soli]|uniref:hypothetical protein n=1 Tax=Cellulomonas soli TaxID=931535 RepID=UPI003F87785A
MAGRVPSTLDELLREPPGPRAVLDGLVYRCLGATSPVRLLVDAATHQRHRPLTGELARSASDADPLWIDVRAKSVERLFTRSYQLEVRGGTPGQVVTLDAEHRRVEIWTYRPPVGRDATELQGNAKDGFWCWVDLDDIVEVSFFDTTL